MHMVVTCCQCTRQLRLPSEVIGTAVRCPLCKATFMTRAISDDHAEAIPMAEKPRNLELDADDPPLIPQEKHRDLPLEALPAESIGSYDLQDEAFDTFGTGSGDPFRSSAPLATRPGATPGGVQRQE